MKALQLGSLRTNILLNQGLFEIRAHWHIDLMDLSANCSSGVNDLHLVFLSVVARRLEIDTADEISRPSMRPLR